MKLRKLAILFCIATFAGLVQVAQAGIIRYTGGEIAKGAAGASQAAVAGGAAVAAGTVAAGQTTANAAAAGLSATKGGVAAAAGGVAAAGATAGDVVGHSTSGAANAFKNAPTALGNGARSVARKVWRITW